MGGLRSKDMPHPSVQAVQNQVRALIRKLYKILDARICPHMETPAPTPETIVPSEATQEPAVSPPLASAPEVADGKQSQSDDFLDPDNWQAQLDAFLANGGDAATSEAPPVTEPTAPEAVVEPVVTPPAAGEAVVDEETADTSDARYGPRHRIQPRSETDAAALKLMSRNPDMTMVEALAKVTGTTQPEAAAQAEAPPTPAAVAESELEALTTKQNEKKLELQAAHEAMDFEQVGKLNIELLDMMEQKAVITAKVSTEKAQAEAAANAAFDAKVAEAEAQTLRLYPSAAAANSPLHAKMTAIYSAMESTNNPLLNDPHCTLKIAQMAANELSIAPVTAPVPAPVVQTAPPPRALTQVRPAAGGQVSGAVAPAALSDVNQVGSADWTPEQWEAFNAKMFG